MLKISFREFGMSFKNAIIIASDIGDLIYKESNRKGELSERRGRKTRDLLDERTYGCRGYLQMSPLFQTEGMGLFFLIGKCDIKYTGAHFLVSLPGRQVEVYVGDRTG